MNRIPYKVRKIIGFGLVLLSIVALTTTIVCGAHGAPLWLLILISVAAIVSFIIGIILVPQINENGTPFAEEKDFKIKKPNKFKVKKAKKPFMTNEEWREQEEEDDEMMFVEETVEDD